MKLELGFTVSDLHTDPVKWFREHWNDWALSKNLDNLKIEKIYLDTVKDEKILNVIFEGTQGDLWELFSRYYPKENRTLLYRFFMKQIKN